MGRKAMRDEAAAALRLARRRLVEARNEMNHARSLLEYCASGQGGSVAALADVSESGTTWALSMQVDHVALQVQRLANRLSPPKKRT